MASSIDAITSGAGGIVTTADNTGILQLKTAGTTAVTVDASQNVGIGTTSPFSAAGYKSLTINGSTSGLLALQANGTNSCYLYSDGSALNFKGLQNIPLDFYTNDTYRMRIDTSGNVGIGTSSPGAKLQVAGSSLFQDQMQIFNNPTSSAQGILFRNTFNVGASIFSMGAATTNGIIAFVGGNGTQGGISGNGAGISYTSASDYRLKENVAPMTNALAKVSQLNPCTFTWKSDGSAGQGFIAHELQAVVPEAVFGEKDAVDEDGNIKPQSIDTSFLVATLTAAIQEQQTIIETLKADIVELKAKVK